MNNMGQLERITQNHVVKFFQNRLQYDYLADWQDRKNNKNIEEDLLATWLRKQGTNGTLINKALRELDRASALGGGKNLYDANKAVYSLLRYGIKVKPKKRS